jgi:hypothetical protein
MPPIRTSSNRPFSNVRVSSGDSNRLRTTFSSSPMHRLRANPALQVDAEAELSLRLANRSQISRGPSPTGQFGGQREMGYW